MTRTSTPRAARGGTMAVVAAAALAGTSGSAATAAALAGPESIAVDGSGNLLIADTTNNRVREVTG